MKEDFLGIRSPSHLGRMGRMVRTRSGRYTQRSARRSRVGSRRRTQRTVRPSQKELVASAIRNILVREEPKLSLSVQESRKLLDDIERGLEKGDETIKIPGLGRRHLTPFMSRIQEETDAMEKNE